MLLVVKIYSMVIVFVFLFVGARGRAAGAPVDAEKIYCPIDPFVDEFVDIVTRKQDELEKAKAAGVSSRSSSGATTSSTSTSSTRSIFNEESNIMNRFNVSFLVSSL